MAWENVPASDSLLAEFNAAFPNRDKGTDGTKGDDAHAQRSSDHNPDETGKTPFEDADSDNEVHARDIGDRLNRPGWTMARCVDIIVTRHRLGLDRRLQNIIHHGKVISRSWGWDGWRDSSGHETWAHFGFRYGSGAGTANPENITAPWGILAAIEREIDVAKLDEDDYARIKNDMFKVLTESRPVYQVTRIADRGWSNMTFKQQLDYMLESLVAGQPHDANEDGAATESASVQARLSYLEEMIEDIKAAVTAPPAE